MRTWASGLVAVGLALGISACGSAESEVEANAAVSTDPSSVDIDSSASSEIGDASQDNARQHDETTSTSMSGSESTTTTSASPQTTVDAPEVETTSTTSTSTTTSTTSTSTTSITTTTVSNDAAPASSEAAPSEDEPQTATTVATTTTTTEAASDGPVFEAQVVAITGPIVSQITSSWREGCPVGLDELRLISLSHWNNAGNVVGGQLIVHQDYAADIVQVFSRLFDAEFPIERMQLVDNFGGDDDLSMAANNTSAFNCREIAARPGTWSNHAFGAAIDINPLVNPLVSGSGVFPPGGAAFTDRSVQVQGGIYPGDVVTQAFAEIGWGWGGDWANSKDWQHFSATGR